MPIVEVEMLINPGERLKPNLAQQLADGIGEILGTPKGHTWVRLRALSRAQYAENGGHPPLDTKPIFISVLKYDLASTQKLRVEVKKLTKTIAQATGRSGENIHILYLPKGKGRIAFGGNLLE